MSLGLQKQTRSSSSSSTESSGFWSDGSSVSSSSSRSSTPVSFTSSRSSSQDDLEKPTTTPRQFCKFYFYRQCVPAGKKCDQLIAPVESAAKQRNWQNKSVLIRSDIHRTKIVDGRTFPDGPHITVSFKDKAEVETERHKTCHIYVESDDSWEAGRISVYGAKPDTFPKGYNGKPKAVWPKACDLTKAIFREVA